MSRVSLQKARELWGHKITIASQSALQEGEDKWRIIHVGTHYVRVNCAIIVKDYQDCSQIEDNKAILEGMEKKRRRSGSVSYGTLSQLTALSGRPFQTRASSSVCGMRSMRSRRAERKSKSMRWTSAASAPHRIGIPRKPPPSYGIPSNSLRTDGGD